MRSLRTVTCICGVSFQDTSSMQTRKYCGYACAHKADSIQKTLKRQVSCLTCGSPFLTTPRRDQKYCSHACYPRQPKGPRKTIVCPCGKSFEARPPSKKQYCTLECSWRYSTKRGRKPGYTSERKGIKSGIIPWNKGIPCSEEQKEQLRKLYEGKAITCYGRGGDPSPMMLVYKDILCPLGYEMDAVHIPISTGGTYMLDFAHREAKIDIEIDGITHAGRKAHDEKRDAYLKSLGWKVIRVRHW